MSRTVNIIGAGPGGLATAMLLAQSGVRVRVLERLAVPVHGRPHLRQIGPEVAGLQVVVGRDEPGDRIAHEREHVGVVEEGRIGGAVFRRRRGRGVEVDHARWPRPASTVKNLLPCGIVATLPGGRKAAGPSRNVSRGSFRAAHGQLPV